MGSQLEMYCTDKCSLLTRYASPQNQERPGCSGETEGVRRYPPSLWQGDERHKSHIKPTICLSHEHGFNFAVCDDLYYRTYLVWITLKRKNIWDRPLYDRVEVLFAASIWFWLLFHRGSVWLYQLLLRLCVWSPLARWDFYLTETLTDK